MRSHSLAFSPERLEADNHVVSREGGEVADPSVLTEHLHDSMRLAAIRYGDRRNTHRERRDVLMQQLLTQCGDIMTPVPTDVGMHLIVWLKKGLDELVAHTILLEQGIETIPLSIFSIVPQKKAGLVLGFSGTQPKQIPGLVGEMAGCLRSLVEVKRHETILPG